MCLFLLFSVYYLFTYNKTPVLAHIAKYLRILIALRDSIKRGFYNVVLSLYNTVDRQLALQFSDHMSKKL